jgi:hypothetical protein
MLFQYKVILSMKLCYLSRIKGIDDNGNNESASGSGYAEACAILEPRGCILMQSS